MEGLQVYKCPYPKIRLGCPNLGGEVIADLSGDYDMFLSVGVIGEISFEEQFLARYSSIKEALALDYRIGSLDSTSSLNFNNVTVSELPMVVKLNLALHKDVFLKLDIQGYEYMILPAILEELKNVKQLMIQFHSNAEIVEKPNVFAVFKGLKQEAMLILMKTLATTHTLVHVHPNNGSNVHYMNDFLIPNVFTGTWVRNTEIPDRQKTLAAIPTPLDQPAYPEKPVFIFSGDPWTA